MHAGPDEGLTTIMDNPADIGTGDSRIAVQPDPFSPPEGVVRLRDEGHRDNQA